MTEVEPRHNPAGTAAAWRAREALAPLSWWSRARRDRWLARDPSHRAAYEAVGATVDAFLPYEDDPIIAGLRAGALALRPSRSRAQRLAWPALPTASALAVAVVAVLVAPDRTARLIALPSDASQLYRTSINERSSFVLADGSELSLNTESVVRVRYSSAERRIDLLEGEAHFDVAPMPSRPFVVHAGARTVTAVGTSFDVRLHTDGEPFQVTLLEGHVVVDADDAHSVPSQAPKQPRTELRPGDRLVAPGDGAPRVERVDLAHTAGWRDGRLIVENVELAEFVRAANRYSDMKIVVGDPNLARFKMGGVFKVGDAKDVARTLTDYLPVRYRIDGNRIVLLPRQ